MLPVFPFRSPTGFPSPAEEWIEKRLSLDGLVLRHPDATFYAQMDGNMMWNAGMSDGDIVVIDRAVQPIDGSIVVARMNGEYLIRRLHILTDQVLLRAEHPDFPLVDVSGIEDFEIFGVVIGFFHPYTFSLI